LDSAGRTELAVRGPLPPLAIEVEIKGAKLRIPPNAGREAILAVMDGLSGVPKRRR
jgi:hypothetical protein